MSLSLPLEHAKHGSVRQPVARAATTALAVAGFALVVAFVAFVRTFAFEYFHGNPAALEGFVRAIVGN